MENKSIPAAAAFARGGELQFGDNGPNAKTAPITMVARTGQPIDHWYWGTIVHDLSGMKWRKPRLAIDFSHNEDEPLGYINKHEIDENGNLVVSGALIPFKDGDRASEILAKGKEGVPFESSIDFSDEMVIEEIAPGQITTVNGYQLTGPCTVVREWYLRGVAVCLYGADPNTSTNFSKDKTIQVKMKGTQMDNTGTEAAIVAVEEPKTETPVEEPAQLTEAKVEAEVIEAQLAEGQPVEAVAVEVTEAVEAEAVQLSQITEPQKPEAPGLKFIREFGERGAVWFAEGKTFEEAAKLHTEDIKAENARLKKQLETLGMERGEKEPVSFKVSDPQPKTKKSIKDGFNEFAKNVK